LWNVIEVADQCRVLSLVGELLEFALLVVAGVRESRVFAERISIEVVDEDGGDGKSLRLL
jgi:hypothetical protein